MCLHHLTMGPYFPILTTPCPAVDAINSSHAAELPEAAAAAAHRQLAAYFRRFQPRLAPSNCRHIQTLMRCAQVRGAEGHPERAAAADLAGQAAATLIEREGTWLKLGSTTTALRTSPFPCCRCSAERQAARCRWRLPQFLAAQGQAAQPAAVARQAAGARRAAEGRF